MDFSKLSKQLQEMSFEEVTQIAWTYWKTYFWWLVIALFVIVICSLSYIWYSFILSTNIDDVQYSQEMEARKSKVLFRQGAFGSLLERSSEREGVFAESIDSVSPIFYRSDESSVSTDEDEDDLDVGTAREDSTEIEEQSGTAESGNDAQVVSDDDANDESPVSTSEEDEIEG